VEITSQNKDLHKYQEFLILTINKIEKNNQDDRIIKISDLTSNQQQQWKILILTPKK
jgi:hypothetical protein